jgi:hypothetical protein
LVPTWLLLLLLQDGSTSCDQCDRRSEFIIIMSVIKRGPCPYSLHLAWPCLRLHL